MYPSLSPTLFSTILPFQFYPPRNWSVTSFSGTDLWMDNRAFRTRVEPSAVTAVCLGTREGLMEAGRRWGEARRMAFMCPWGLWKDTWQIKERWTYLRVALADPSHTYLLPPGFWYLQSFVNSLSRWLYLKPGFACVTCGLQTSPSSQISIAQTLHTSPV